MDSSGAGAPNGLHPQTARWRVAERKLQKQKYAHTLQSGAHNDTCHACSRIPAARRILVWRLILLGGLTSSFEKERGFRAQ